MGLAFLSDIQVYMFMEAAQGDQRTNVMQAPKLTLFNGQTATITVQDYAVLRDQRDGGPARRPGGLRAEQHAAAHGGRHLDHARR